jgi:hypothetical protein
MSFDWPENPSSPDGPDEHLFVPLDDEEPELAERLTATVCRAMGG